MIVKWLHAPGHAGSVGPKVVEFAGNHKPLLIDWSEMYWNTDDLLENLKDYHHFIGDAVRTDARKRPVGHDVVVSVHKDAKIISEKSFFVSGEISQIIKYMPERWGKVVVFEYKDYTFGGVFWHPQPNPLRRLSLVFAKYKRGLERVQRAQNRMIEEFHPDVVFNGGDLQLGAGKLWVHPNQFAGRNQMWFKSDRIDWQMWKGAVTNFVSFVKINPAKINSAMDHIWTQLSIHIPEKDLKDKK